MVKKIGCLALALIMVLAMTATAFASETQINGGNTSAAPTLATENDIGVAGTWIKPDTEIVDNGKKINIVKELLSFNANSTSVYAPVFSYVYTVTPATVSNFTVTDQASDHTSNQAVTAPVKTGITTGLKVAGNTIAGNESSAVGYLDFTNDTSLITSSSGGSNKYNIELDFSGVTFVQPGVYRYQIAETITKPDHTTAVTYDNIAVKDADANGTNPNTRWLDVYVDGNLAIYGYVCMATNGSVTPETTKTNGFVTASGGDDKYYTYDLELSKDVENDTYGQSHAFPFTVIFQNSESYENTTFKITETVTTGSTGITPAVGLPTWSGVAKVKEGAVITYSGVPAGVDVDVYETNDMTGVTYTVETSVNGATTGTGYNKDDNVSSGTAPSAAAAQTSKADYESTKMTVDTPKIGTVSAKQTLKITNTLLLISPTGITLRVAPYALILAAGIALLLISRRRRADKEEIV